MKPENLEKIALLSDKIENLGCGLELPMLPLFHVEQMKKQLPRIAEEIRTIYKEETGENPWE
jgi:hypothetical protein